MILKDRSVIVTETPVRDKPSYAGKILGKLEYTDRVQVLELPAGFELGESSIRR